MEVNQVSRRRVKPTIVFVKQMPPESGVVHISQSVMEVLQGIPGHEKWITFQIVTPTAGWPR
jgi:hypothetical protein